MGLGGDGSTQPENGRLPSDQDASGRSFGPEVMENLASVIGTGTLFGPKGAFVRAIESDFARWSGSAYALACSSGTAAVHTALSALEIGPGDEVVTTSITDIGALTPILYQGAIPVFADVDPDSGNLTAGSVAERMTARTKAVIVTHLFGNPADVIGIGEVASQWGVPFIEDCAQAFGATISDRPVGRFGDIAAFSLQQGKHITSGEGGLISTESPDLARHMRLFVNKSWDYDSPTDHDFLALNYRMTELQAAVAQPQLATIDENIARRRRNAKTLLRSIEDVPGVVPAPMVSGADPSYWRIGLLIDPAIVPGGTDALAARLGSVDVPAASRYIKKPAFQTRLFTEQRTFGDSRWPFTLATSEALDYSPGLFPGTFEFLSRVLVIPWNERLTEEHVERISSAIVTGVGELLGAAA